MLWKKRGTETTIKDIVLRNTGLNEKDFFYPKQNPHIENLQKAVDMLKDAIAEKLHITIMGDYDADGITATAILYRLLIEGMKYNDVSIRLPKRFSEGYGLSMKVIDEISSGLLITIDNGITAIDEIAAAKAKGIKVIVIDHHLCDEKKGLPDANVIVNPNALPGSEYNNYCGAGLAYRLAIKTESCSQKLLSSLSALAAIGTIADVMDLTHDNRNIVISGLQAINKREIPKGLCELLDSIGLYTVNETDIGFKIAPIINACGRVIDYGAKFPFLLLATDNYNPKLVEKLITINNTRKDMVKKDLVYAEKIIAEECLYGDFPLIIYGKFNEGVVGIVAGKIAEKFKVPTFILTDANKENLIKGSGRSYGDINLKHLLDKAADILTAYGGHAGAAGLSLSFDNLNALRKRLTEEAKSIDISDASNIEYYDLEIDSDNIVDAENELEKYSPYGEGNPKIIFKIKEYKLLPKNSAFYQSLGDGSIIKFFNTNSSAIGFGLADKFLDEGQPIVLNLYGTIGINRFNRKSEIQIEVLDFEKCVHQTEENTLYELLKQRMKSI